MSTETETSSDVEDLDTEVSEASTDDQTSNDTDQTDDDAELGDEQSGEDDGEGDEGDGLEDVEFEGKTYRLTPEVKAALLRQADYTRKTQEISATSKKLAEDRAALEARETAAVQQVERAQKIDKDRVQLAQMDAQLAALDGLDWAKLDEDDPEEAHKLFRERVLLQDRRTALKERLGTAEQEFETERKRSAAAAHVQAVRDCEAVLRKDIKGWDEKLAEKVGDFAIETLGWDPRALPRLTDPVIVKTLHQAYVGHQAQKKLAAQARAAADGKTTPVTRPGGGGASPSARRTTDGSGDGLSIDEWMKREAAREESKRAPKRK